MTQTQRGVLGTVILALTMTFGSMSAHAALISYNFTYAPFKTGIGTDDVFLDVTIFLDDSQIPNSGIANVVLDRVDVFFDINPSNSNLFESFANNQTGILSDPGPLQGQNRVPYNIDIDFNGNLTSALDGFQRIVVLPGISTLQFVAVASGGPFGNTLWASTAVQLYNEFVQDPDTAKLVQSSITGPTQVNVIPLPAALPLFLTGLAGLGLMRWRRRQTRGR